MDNEELKTSLKESQLEVISVDNKAFDREKSQNLVLELDLNVNAMDFLKIICDGQLVDLESEIFEVEGMPEKEFYVEQISDDNVNQPIQ